MSFLSIDPADFPDVPTRKALIAIDLQNDFLSDDGALPVKQPHGMIGRVIRLAEALRNCGYGEVVWVRSQFDTARPASEQQIMATDLSHSPQGPQGPDSSPDSIATRTTRSPLAASPLEADSEAFLSVVEGAAAAAKPLCVRKGTNGADLLPAISNAKGPRDYAMTKSYYSAFQSGQLLKLLRRQFATELFICGALSNVSVYATALAASCHGFDITIVEDCCGYRSETRHMNTRRKLTELTGCKFATAAEIIPTLRPKSSSQASGNERSIGGVGGPGHIPPELIAAAMAGSKNSPAKGLPVRAKPVSPSTVSPHSTEEKRNKGKAKAAEPPSPSASLSPDVSGSMEKLKLNTANPAGRTNVSGSSSKAHPAKVASSRSKDASAKPQAGQAVQPVVSNALRATAQDADERDDGESPAVTDCAAEPDAREDKGKMKALDDIKPVAPTADKEASNPVAESGTSQGVKTSRTMDFYVSGEVLTAETPTDMLKSPYHAGRSDEYVAQKPISQPTKASKDEEPEKSHRVETTGDSPSTKANTQSAESETGATVSDPLCEGDTNVTYNFLPPSLVEGLFERLCVEVHFMKMLHQGGEVPRFVAVQGEVEEDGTQPVYRHPSDETMLAVPYTPAVQKIREHVERRLGHKVNHVLIQCYRNGNDYISEHSDKTIDIVKGSYIANVSLGAERTMVFRSKRGEKNSPKQNSGAPDKSGEEQGSTPTTTSAEEDRKDEIKPPTTSPPKRQSIRCSLPHNSLLKMGLATNLARLHGIRPDKRPQFEKTPAELAWAGARISLTFRHIGTFLSPSSSQQQVIWGQGAVGKTRDAARPVASGVQEVAAMLRAFGRENNSPDFDWDTHYGRGFDVLHIKAAPPRYFGGDVVADSRARLMLAECGVRYDDDRGGGDGIAVSNKGVVPVRFEVDNRTTIVGDVAILLFLDAKHPKKKNGGDAEIARIYTRFYAAVALGQRWKATRDNNSDSGDDTVLQNKKSNRIPAALRADLAEFEAWAAEGDAIAGADVSIADYALWPVLHDMATKQKASEDGDGVVDLWGEMGFGALGRYYTAFSRRKSAVEVLGRGLLTW